MAVHTAAFLGISVASGTLSGGPASLAKFLSSCICKTHCSREPEYVRTQSSSFRCAFFKKQDFQALEMSNT